MNVIKWHDIEIEQDLPWQLRAACRGPQSHLFFPPPHPERKDERERRENLAKSICSECDVRDDCLDYALTTREQHGIWGATTEAERRSILTTAG